MIVVVAEGDDAGNAFTIAKKVQELAPEFDKTRVTVIGHLQRGGSPTAFDRILGGAYGGSRGGRAYSMGNPML